MLNDPSPATIEPPLAQKLVDAVDQLVMMRAALSEQE